MMYFVFIALQMFIDLIGDWRCQDTSDFQAVFGYKISDLGYIHTNLYKVVLYDKLIPSWLILGKLMIYVINLLRHLLAVLSFFVIFNSQEGLYAKN